MVMEFDEITWLVSLAAGFDFIVAVEVYEFGDWQVKLWTIQKRETDIWWILHLLNHNFTCMQILGNRQGWKRWLFTMTKSKNSDSEWISFTDTQSIEIHLAISQAWSVCICFGFKNFLLINKNWINSLRKQSNIYFISSLMLLKLKLLFLSLVR